MIDYELLEALLVRVDAEAFYVRMGAIFIYEELQPTFGRGEVLH